MRRICVSLAAFAAVLAFAATASAHIVVVTPKGQGNGTTHWVGGGPVPGHGAGLIASPIGMLPAAHALGLVHACIVTSGSAVMFIPPPFNIADTDCMHGEP